MNTKSMFTLILLECLAYDSNHLTYSLSKSTQTTHLESDSINSMLSVY